MYREVQRIDLMQLIASFDFDRRILLIFLGDQIELAAQVINRFRNNAPSGGTSDTIALGFVFRRNLFQHLLFSHGTTSEEL